MREKQEAIKDKTFDKLSDLNVSKSSPTKDLIDMEKDSFKNGDKIDKNIVISEDQRDSTSAMKHTSGSDEENGKLASTDSKDEKTVSKKVLLDDRESKASRQSDARQTPSSLKENVEDAELKEDKDLNKRDDIKFSQKMQANEKQKMEAFAERSTDDDKYLDDSAHGKSADLSSTESMLNVEESLSPERTDSPCDKKLERIKRNDKERPETETGKSPKYVC